MPLFSSIFSPTLWPHYGDTTAKMSPGREGIDELEIVSYLTSSSESGSEPRSHQSSPLSESAMLPPVPYISDDTDMYGQGRTMLHHEVVLDMPPFLVGVDPRWLSISPCSTTMNSPDECKELPPQLCAPATPAHVFTPDRQDDGPEYDDYESGSDDDEYIPSDEARQLKSSKLASSLKRCAAKPLKKPTVQRTRSPGSPSLLTNTTSGYSKHRARNAPVSTDVVMLELSRIAHTKTSVKKSSRRKLSCQLCGTNFTRPSDLQRHVLTHDRSRTNSVACIGLSMEEALEYNIDPTQLNTCNWEDELRVGGCGESFSRNDALLRHVKLKRSRCLLLRTGQLIRPSC
ncbi:hypothetical protein AX15_000056 [Amanita polypyramis BW_CC]|nr:hypothetical protein AX15_000056 [Amanita polypyramis BW_CC]